MFLIAAGFLYADEKFNMAIEWMADSVYVRRFFGAYSDKDDTTSENPYRYQGDGITNSFQPSMFGNGMIGRVGLNYTGEKIGGSFSLRMAGDTAYNNIVDWSSWIKFGSSDSFNVRVLAGHNEQKGKLGNFGILFPVWRKQGNYVPNNYFASTINFPYGYPNPNLDMGFVEFYQTETSDVFMPAGANARKLLNVLVDFNFEPFTLTLATGGLYANDTIPLANINSTVRGEEIRGLFYDAVYDPATIGGMNFAIRAESALIANMLRIGATYKHTSSIYSKIFPPDAPAPFDPVSIIDENKSNHTYGLFSVLSFPDTSISIGYSGLYQTWKNPQYKHTFVALVDILEHEFSDYSEAIHPVFHGIDLGFTYTGFNKLTISLNNNLSFAQVQGITRREYDEGKYSLGWAYREFLGNQTGDGEGRSERYIGIANELGLHYELNDRFSINTNVSSQLGTFTLLTDTGDNPDSYSHYLNISAGVHLTMFDSPKVKGVLYGGFNMRLTNFSYQHAQTMDKFTAGLVEVAVPLSFSLRY